MSIPFEAWNIADQCRSGTCKPVDVVRTTFDRIRKADPGINAFLQLDASASLERAEALEAAGPPASGSGRLFGVPIAIKDNICVQGYRCTCGSKILHGYRPVYNATVVERILDEGGVIIGKTNHDEFAMGSSTEFSAFKTTLNPWDSSRIPGGSSGGSAAAVAAAAVPLALGSDTGGSIRQPASFCGIVGFKPTYGTVSRYGLIAFASSLDQIGPFGMNVRDTALLYQVIAGHDRRDSTSIPSDLPQVLDGLEQDLSGIKIGIPEEYFSSEIVPAVRSEVEKGLDLLEKCGGTLQGVSLPHTRYAIPAYYLVANSEASSNLARFDGIRYGPRVEKKGLMETYGATRKAGFGPEVKRRIMLGTFALSSGYYDAFYMKALKVRRLIQEDFNRVFKEVDLVAGPTSPIPAFKVDEKIEDPLTMYLCDILTTPASLAGIPGISVPCGLEGNGLPIGLQILGPPLHDHVVLRAARALEKRRGDAPVSSIAKAVMDLEAEEHPAGEREDS